MSLKLPRKEMVVDRGGGGGSGGSGGGGGGSGGNGSGNLGGRIRRYSDRMISSCKDLAQECTVLMKKEKKHHLNVAYCCTEPNQYRLRGF